MVTTHQQTRTIYGQTNGQPMESRITLAGPCVAAPSVTPIWTRPVTLAPVYRSVIATKVIAAADEDTFVGAMWTPEQMIAAVKREQARPAFTSRWAKHSSGGGIPIGRQAAMEASILAAMVGEQRASQIAKAAGHSTATTATALARMAQDGRVIRRYGIWGDRQIGMYRRASL